MLSSDNESFLNNDIGGGSVLSSDNDPGNGDTGMVKDRTNQILELLTKENRMEVSELASKLGVSQVTMRKDLDALERKKIIHREHGFAVLRSIEDINGRIAYHYDAKVRIAMKASELVRDGSTVMIESGSCCAIMADLLSTSRRNLTIVTNSAFIPDYIRGRSNVQTILLGGIYQNDAQVMVGPMIRECASSFCVDLFFVGTDGYSSGRGFTNCDQMRAQAVRDMAASAERVIVLTESEKFDQRGAVPLGVMDHVYAVITDSHVPPAISEELSRQNIKTIIADEAL